MDRGAASYIAAHHRWRQKLGAGATVCQVTWQPHTGACIAWKSWSGRVDHRSGELQALLTVWHTACSYLAVPALCSQKIVQLTLEVHSAECIHICSQRVHLPLQLPVSTLLNCMRARLIGMGEAYMLCCQCRVPSMQQIMLPILGQLQSKRLWTPLSIEQYHQASVVPPIMRGPSPPSKEVLLGTTLLSALEVCHSDSLSAMLASKIF